MDSPITDSDLQNTEFQEQKLFTHVKNKLKAQIMKVPWILNKVSNMLRMTQVIDAVMNIQISMQQIEQHNHMFKTPYQELIDEIEAEKNAETLPGPMTTPRAPMPERSPGMVTAIINSVSRQIRRTGLRSSPRGQAEPQNSVQSSVEQTQSSAPPRVDTEAAASTPRIRVQELEQDSDDDTMSIRSGQSMISHTSTTMTHQSFTCPVNKTDLDDLRMLIEQTVQSIITSIIATCPIGRALIEGAHHRYPSSAFPGTILVAMIRQLANTNLGSKMLQASTKLDKAIEILPQTASMAAYTTVIRNNVETVTRLVATHYPAADPGYQEGVRRAISVVVACRILDQMKYVTALKTDTLLWVNGTQKQNYGKDLYDLTQLLKYLEAIGEHKPDIVTPTNLTTIAPAKTKVPIRKCHFCIDVFAGNRPNDQKCLEMALDHEKEDCPSWGPANKFITDFLTARAARRAAAEAPRAGHDPGK